LKRWVYLMAFSPSGRELAARATQGNLRVWDVSTGDVLRSERIAGDGLQWFLDPGGPALVVGPDFLEWFPASADLRPLESSYTRWESVTAMAVSPDNRTVAFGLNTGEIDLVDVLSGQTLRTVIVADGVRRIEFSPDGRALLAETHFSGITIWDVGTGQPIRTLEGETFAFSPDGRALAIGDTAGVIQFWDFGAGELLAKIQGHAAGSTIYRLAFTPDGRRLLSAGVDGTLRQWGLP
jgi:WD40 repeat protein